MRSNLDFELDLEVSRRYAGRNVDTNVDAARLEAHATERIFITFWLMWTHEGRGSTMA